MPLGSATALARPKAPSQQTVELSVVIVNYRTWEETQGLIDRLRTELDPFQHEILVVNNCRRTRLPQALADEEGEVAGGVRFVESVRNVGFGGAVNLGAACARGSKLLILNPDVTPHHGAIRSLLTTHRRYPRAAILLPRLLGADGGEQRSVRTFYRLETILAARTLYGRTRRGAQVIREHLGEELDRSREQPVDWGLGAAMLVDLDRVPRERGRVMDDRFFLYMEDVDLCLRTWRAGLEVLFVPSATFTHHHRQESRRNPLSIANMRHFFSLLRFMAKYRGLPQRGGERG